VRPDNLSLRIFFPANFLSTSGLRGMVATGLPRFAAIPAVARMPQVSLVGMLGAVKERKDEPTM